MNRILTITWDHEARELVITLPPRSTADTCVLFSGREVKRVEFLADDRDGAARSWDSCNGENDLHPTPISGGFFAFLNPGADARAIVVRALHSGGVSCYMDHGPATLPFDDAPEIMPNLSIGGVESTTARYIIDRDDAIEVVIVVRENENEAAGEATPLRTQTEAVVRRLLRARVAEGGERSDRGLRAVA